MVGRSSSPRSAASSMLSALPANPWLAIFSWCGPISSQRRHLLGSRQSKAEPIRAIEASLRLDFTRETDRFEGRDIIAGLVKRWCLDRTLQDIAATFDEHGVCW